MLIAYTSPGPPAVYKRDTKIGAIPVNKKFLRAAAWAIACLTPVAAWGCTGGAIIKVDGSSTVFPITEAMAEEFQKEHGELRVTVGISGTGGGFKKLCNGEIDLTGASRPIKPIELDACGKSGIGFIELPVAYDGLTVIVNPENDWVDHLTTEELGLIWMPGSPVNKWSDVRPGWPDEDINLVGADTDSGTFDYFTKTIVGEEGASRPDYTANADDNVLVTAIAGDDNALGYFGYAYYAENTDKLKLVPVDPGTGPVAPSVSTISSGTYAPLSRPLFIYVNAEDAQKPGVREFVRFFLDPENSGLVREVGYVDFPPEVSGLVQQRFEQGTTGSVFGGKGSQVGVTIKDLLGGD